MVAKVEDVTYLLVGEHYLVNCICLDKTDEPQFDVRLLEEQSRFDYLPILGPAHVDYVIGEHGSDLGLIESHYHLDQRFMTDAQIKKRVVLFADYSIREKVVDWNKDSIAEGKYRETRTIMKCLRKDFPVKVALRNIEKKFIHSNAINNRCPHKGAYLGNLEVEDNCVQCPMHGLKFDSYTKKCIGAL